MAMNESHNGSAPASLLNRTGARTAGILSVVLAGMAAAAAAYGLLTLKASAPALNIAGAIALAVCVAVAAAGIALIRGKTWAQRLLLAVWLAVLTGIVALWAAAILWPDWWPTAWPMFSILIPLAGLNLFAVGTLIWASAHRSRLRYSTYVSVAIAAAVAVVVVANMFSQVAYARRDIETLGRFSISQRTRKVLKAVNQPMRITCIYTGQDKKDQTNDRRSRTMELLRDLGEQNKLIKIDNITTDEQKAALVRRLRQKLADKHPEYVKLLNDFRGQAGSIIKALDRQRSLWDKSSGSGYLDQWGLASGVARLMKQTGQQFEKVRDKIQADSDLSGLPDYGQLAGDLKSALKSTADMTKIVSGQIKDISEIPGAIKANRNKAMQTADQAASAVQAMADALGGEEQGPADAAATLKKFVNAAGAASKQLQQAAALMKNIAGKDHADLIEAAQAWQAKTGGRRIMTPGGIVFQQRRTITNLYADAAATVTRIKVEANAFLQAANTEHQAKVVGQLRKTVASIQTWLAEINKEAGGAIQTLANVDRPTAKLLADATGDQAFKQITKPVNELLAQTDTLPKLPSSTLARDITGKNIILLETDDKTRAIDFESVWPLRVRPTGFGQPAGPQQRDFNGDSAVGSAILAMTHKPFATVLITYYKPDVPRQMERMIPPASVSPDKLTSLSDRLKEANFQVDRWNLRQDRPKAKPGQPQVLLVLPPAKIPPASSPGQPKLEPFGKQQLDRLKRAIDGGTPAIFLAEWQPPRRMSFFGPAVNPPYLLNKYLTPDWGIKVLTDYLVLSAVPDPNMPRKLRPDAIAMNWFPLSAFSNHIIGRYLQGQRMLWQQLAIVKRVGGALPEGVTIQPLLTVDRTYRNVWATNRLEDLATQFQANEGSHISPNYKAGDIHVPFDVAVVATRVGGQKLKPSRIVVLGLAGGLQDGYLNRRAQQLGPDGGVSLSDAPWANADVVTNSVYWMIGLEGYVARGPARVKPIAVIKPNMLAALQWTGILVLPLLVLAIGGIVLFARRRG